MLGFLTEAFVNTEYIAVMKKFLNLLLIIMTAVSVNAATNEHGKVLSVKRISIEGVELHDMPAHLDALGVEFEQVDVANWPEWNKQTPDAQFRVAHSGDNLIINFKCTENSVAATANDMGWNVWEDACMEFFSQPTDDGIYYNIECNCAGTVLLNGGPTRNERTHASRETTMSIKRWASLGREPFAERVGQCTWQVVLLVPASYYFMHQISDFGGRTIRANFYKCGDKLQQPHFLSWNPIGTQRPNFHAPEYFGTLVFEK